MVFQHFSNHAPIYRHLNYFWFFFYYKLCCTSEYVMPETTHEMSRYSVHFCLLLAGFSPIVSLVFDCDNGDNKRLYLLEDTRIMELWFLLSENPACALRAVHLCYRSPLSIPYAIYPILPYHSTHRESDASFYIAPGVDTGTVSITGPVTALKGSTV